MEITFLGAAGCVTGSKFLIRLYTGEQILLDCGLFQGLGEKTWGLNNHFEFNPAEINYLILSHAHIDHSGLIPKLVKEGFSGKIFCSNATFDLCSFMLPDSGHIQEADVRFVNKRKAKQKKELLKPLYTLEDAKKCLAFFKPVEVNTEITINPNFSFSFIDNGHILGSAAVHLLINEQNEMTRLTYTADIGRYNSSLLKDPSPFPQSDLIICESTYGNRTHEPIDNASQQLLNAVINTCSNKGGKLIIPAFSLGRTQELIYTLNKLNLYGLLPEIKIYIDSPLSISATEITKKHVSLLNDSVLEYAHLHDPFGFEKLTYIQTKEESQALNKSDEPCVIISASGMAEAGRVKHHISFAIESHKNTILLVGYAEPTSLAGRLRSGEKLVKIFGQEHNVNAEILTIESLSAHADKNEIIKYLSCQNVNSVRNVFLVHGENDARESLKIMLKKNGFQKVTLPEMGSVYKY